MTVQFAAGLAVVVGAVLAPEAALARAEAPLAVKTSDITVLVVGRGAKTAPDLIHGVSLDGEVATADAEQDYGFRSIRLKLDIDCHSGRDRLTSIEMFPEAHLQGKVRVRPPPGGWAKPSSQAWLADVIQLMCGAPSGLAATQASVLRGAVEPSSTARSAADALTSPASPKPGAVVQVGAADTEAGAQSALDDLKKVKGLSLENLSARVEPAEVKGKRVYRATLSGFAGLPEARALCAAVRKAGAGCFVR
jgi:hypothetical protein